MRNSTVNQESMKAWLYLINDFSHDLFTGLWLACFYVLFRLHSFEIIAAIKALRYEFFYMQTGAMLLIIITGAIRGIHVKNQAAPDNQEIRKSVLVIKHIIMGLLFAAGTILSFKWRF